jgi:alginate O-acetyltransferase complex protein AlgI
MLFNSYEFLFVFLPVALSVFHILRQWRPSLAIYWMLLCSLTFYGYWNPVFLPLLVVSIAANYTIGLVLWRRPRRGPLVIGIVLNLAALGFFKYTLFFATNLLGPDHVPEFIASIVLPLGISFFTFHQIAFLVDVWRGRTAPGRWDIYATFVALFPQLIAGPIVRYRQMEPQLRRIGDPRRRVGQLFLVGLVLLLLGLSKKVLFADSLAPYADGMFDYVARGYTVGFVDAWLGTLAYTLQLYLDFSGYSDMAVGLGLMCGLKLPINFWSPYKATSIVEFWRRWHITLSAFFRDYLYIPLGGSRHGAARRYLNLLVVMTLVGLWHGAGWTFLAWGFYHGVLLMISHTWRSWRTHGRVGSPLQAAQPARREAPRFAAGTVLAWAATFVSVSIGWVFFRAETMESAAVILNGMRFKEGFTGPLALIDSRLYWIGGALVAAGLAVATALPNSLQWVNRLVRNLGLGAYTPPARRCPMQVASLGWTFGLVLGAMGYLAVATMSSASTEFLYFNF